MEYAGKLVPFQEQVAGQRGWELQIHTKPHVLRTLDLLSVMLGTDGPRRSGRKTFWSASGLCDRLVLVISLGAASEHKSTCLPPGEDTVRAVGPGVNSNGCVCTQVSVLRRELREGTVALADMPGANCFV